MRHAGDDRFGDNFNTGEGHGHDDELDEEASPGIDELRKKCSEKQKRLGIGQGRERALPEERPACSRFRRATDVDADRRRAPDLNPEPDQIRAPQPFHDRQPSERRLEQGADAEHGKRDDGDETRDAAEDGVERLASPVQCAVRERQQHVRPGRQGKADSGEEVNQPDV